MKKYLHNRKLIICKCDNCGIEFKKPESEYKRNVSKGRKNFCSRKCVGKHYVNVESNRNTMPPKNVFLGDEYTPFRYYLRNAKSRLKDIKLTLEELKLIWEKQNGICPYSLVNLELKTYKSKNNPIFSASLDRIDSSKGYIFGNVQFVSQAINYMKNTMSHEQTLYLCKLITKNHSSLS